MKRYSIQSKIGLLMMLAVALLAATGYLAYRNLSSIVGSLTVDVNPGQKLLTIREISLDLQKAENSFRMYSVSNDEKDLEPYYSVISGIDDKVSRLQDECSDSPLLLAQTDSVSKLIEENIYIWNELLYLTRNHQVIEYLRQLPERLNIPAEEDQDSGKGILRRVFSRSEKNRIDEQALITDLDRIEKEDQAAREKLRMQEFQLATTSTRIKEQFYDITAKMEAEVSEIMTANATEADRLAARTYRWLAMFLVSGILLALFVVWIITRYVRKTEAYQVALQRSKHEAENLARTKEQFMANMSHEIRTPVTAISGFTEQLLHNPADEDTARMLNIIMSSSRHLEKIINDILDFSKLQDGKMVLERIHFNLRRIVDEVYTLFGEQARKNNTLLSFSIDPDTPGVLLGDPYRLKQIMINLVSNSVKFTNEGKVHFSVSSIPGQTGEITLAMEFTDTGVGIDEDKIDIIFEDFEQEEMSTTRKYGGTGLGLSIVRKLIDLHGGKIECRSRKNHGTTIKCLIPFMVGDPGQVMPEDGLMESVPEEFGRLKVLVVDDEEYNRMLLRTIFSRWGVSHDEASDGQEAVEMVRNGRYDLVLMDMRMPRMDGTTATEYIRNELKMNEMELPVISLTAAVTDEGTGKPPVAGVNAILRKPFPEKELADTILSVIEGSKISHTSDGIPTGITEKAVAGHIDLGNLYHISGGDVRFVREMLITFLEGTEKALISMTEQVEAGEAEKIADTAHKLIPQCRHLGAGDLASILAGVENEGRGGKDILKIRTMLLRFREAFSPVRSEIKDHIESI